MITISVAASSVMSALWFLHGLRGAGLGSEALTLEDLKARTKTSIREEIAFLGQPTILNRVFGPYEVMSLPRFRLALNECRQ